MVSSSDQRIEEERHEKPNHKNSQTEPQPPSAPCDQEATDPIQLPADASLESGDEFLLDKIDRIRQVILQTVSEITDRQRLQELFLQGMEAKITAMLHDLDELRHWRLGNDASIETRRIHIEKELLQLEKEKRINNLACWRDLLSLKKELRDALSEYRTLMKFKEIVS